MTAQIIYAIRVTPYTLDEVRRYEVVSENDNFYIVRPRKGFESNNQTLMKGGSWEFFSTELAGWQWLQTKIRNRIIELKERKNEIDCIVDDMMEKEFMA